MATALGLDLGTSALKAVLIDAGGVRAAAEAPVPVRSPGPGASEQDPEDWWRALEAALGALRADAPREFAAVGAIGLSGQMHGAVWLDGADRPLRPAILWNDTRATREAAEAAALPWLEAAAGLRPGPGMTACKHVWLARHEPDVAAATRRLTLCKDYLRLRMTGEHATDPCDAAGTLLLDEAARDWSDRALDHFGMPRVSLPRVVEGPEPTGRLRPALAAAWGLDAAPVVIAGAGDGAAGALGLGLVAPGEGFVSLGTSAQITITADVWRPAPGSGLQVLAHGLPGLWYRAAALQSGAGAIAWAARMTGRSVPELLAEAAALDPAEEAPVFLPYLAGERTPHDDPDARGVVFGLGLAHGPAHLGRAVLRGLACALADGLAALRGAGGVPAELSVVGGGTRSPDLLALVAAALDTPLVLRDGGGSGAALGVARVALATLEGAEPATFLTPAPEAGRILPDPDLARALAGALPRYRALYRALRPSFAALARA
ncbi:xylulokinase [Amaricoccus solimangrovi]|uniref:Xylulose kinase n=1 Tax=Amaricoccus solimangrovi TaxID=2589815 RepID=A0A501WRI7_9RHOB|nr:xylulokinase [Amaricoccus solimangrovi]TPE49897.1 xylulokinase [Amaricoccus solimangrovi]